MIAMERPSGSGRRKLGRQKLQVWENLSKDRNLVIPPTIDDDHLCLVRCLVFGVAYFGTNTSAESRKFTRQSKKWTIAARELSQKAGVPISKPCGVEELRRFQEHLEPLGFCIRVFTLDRKSCFYKADYKPGQKVLPLVLVSGHFVFIRRLNVYFGRNFFCESCNHPHNFRETHRCGKYCEQCSSEACDGRQMMTNTTMSCPDCRRGFYGQTCFDRHLSSRTGKCTKQRRLCTNCHAEYTFDKRNPHKCFHRWCKICMEHKPPNHRCYVPPKKFRTIPQRGGGADDDDDDGGFLDRVPEEDDDTERGPPWNQPQDLRPNPNSLVQQETGRHIPTLLISQTMFGEKEKVFEGESCVTDFLEYLLENHHNTTVIAHNFRGFDGQFILSSLLERHVRSNVVNEWWQDPLPHS